MPTSRNMAIFVLSTTMTMIRPITLSLEHAREVIIIMESVDSISRDDPDMPYI